MIAACVGDDVAPPSADASADGASADDRSTVDDRFVSNNDAPVDTGSDASDAGLRKCQTIVPPPAPNDFFCADFDGVGLAEGWTRADQLDSGTLTLTQSVFSSPPNALNALGVISDAFAPRGGSLTWEKLGATTIREVDLKFDFNPVAPGGVYPPTDGDVELATIEVGGTGNATVRYSLHHTRGKNLGSGQHIGLYLFASISAGAAAAESDVINTQPTPGSFTTVRILAASSGAVTISYNGVQIFTKSIYAFTESRAAVTLGAVTHGPTAIAENFRFDNFTAQINRN